MIHREVIFVDTGAWCALSDKNDANHKRAVEIYPSLLTNYNRLITSNLVIVETY